MIRKIYQNRIQIAKFVAVGGICAVLEILLFKLFTQQNMLPSYFSFENRKYDFPLSNFLATGAAIVLNYFLSIKFVFNSGKHSKRREFVYFIILSLLTLLVSWRIFATFSNLIITHDFDFGGMTVSYIVFNKVIAIGLTSIFNYILKKRIVFDG